MVILNIQIKYLVNFAEHFYEPLVQFMVGQDPNLQLPVEEEHMRCHISKILKTM